MSTALCVGDIATRLGAEIIAQDSNAGTHLISCVAPFAQAGHGALTFASSLKYLPRLACCAATAILVDKTLAQAAGPLQHACLLVCADPVWAMADIVELLEPEPPLATGRHPTCVIDPGADVAENVMLGPYAVVEAGACIGPSCELSAHAFVGQNARLGHSCRLHPGAKVLRDCVVGNHVILQAGAVIGSDGFGYATLPSSARRKKIPQRGRVILGDDVEIGANTTVDRATFGATTVGDGCKIDNLVQLAHNTTLGRDCVVAGQSGIAGSTTLGDRVVVGAQVGIIGHLQLNDDVTLAARAGVMGSCFAPGVYSGTPALEHSHWLRMVGANRRLPDALHKLRAIERQLNGAPATGEPNEATTT